MTSEEAWKLTETFFRYMSPINYIIIYDHKTKTIHRNSKKILWFWSQTAFTILSLMVSEYYLLLRNSEYLPSHTKSLQAVAFMFGILYAGISGLYIVFTISVGCRGDAFYNCFNTVVRLQQTLQSTFKQLFTFLQWFFYYIIVQNFSDRHGRDVIKLQPQDSRFLKWTILLSLGSVFIPWLLAICLVLFELDPYSFVLHDIYPHLPNSTFVFLIKCITMCYASHIGWFGLFSVLVIALIQLHHAFCIITKCLGVAIELTQVQILSKKKKRRIVYSYKTYTRQVRVIREILYIIKAIRLTLTLADEAFCIIIPFLFLFGEIIFISCSYATIKMYDSIPIPFFLTLSCAAIVEFLFVQILFPYASSVYENSNKSLSLLKSLKAIATDKLWIRTIRATRPPRFNVGSMFYAKRSTKLTCFSCWLNDTINALILF